MSPRILHVLMTVIGATSLISSSPASGEDLDWIRQYGTAMEDYAYGVSADAWGNLYLSGYTESNLFGPSAGRDDAILSKHDSAGNLMWARQVGSDHFDRSLGVSADHAGNIFIAGYTYGRLGTSDYGAGDAFVSKFDGTGAIQWTRQLGSGTFDQASAVASDRNGGVYIAGRTLGVVGKERFGSYDPFVARYDADGTLLWARQFGTAFDDSANGVAVDDLGNIYVTGQTSGRPSGGPTADFDIFLEKFDGDGNLLWARQWGGVDRDMGAAVAIDPLGSAYVTGSSGNRGFLAKWDAHGNWNWNLDIVAGAVRSNGVSTDIHGNVYVAGQTSGDLSGSNAGRDDVFVMKVDRNGSKKWTAQFGTNQSDMVSSLTVDNRGGVYFAGFTFGGWTTPTSGRLDVFVGKLSDVPEPTTSLVFCIGMGFIWIVRRVPQASYQC